VAREGLIAGLAGAVAVAVWFLLYDLAPHAAPHPGLLGATLFHGCAIRRPRIKLRWSSSTPRCNGLAFILFGWAAAGLLALADREPRLLFGVFCSSAASRWSSCLIAILSERLLERSPGGPSSPPTSWRRS